MQTRGRLCPLPNLSSWLCLSLPSVSDGSVAFRIEVVIRGKVYIEVLVRPCFSISPASPSTSPHGTAFLHLS